MSHSYTVSKDNILSIEMKYIFHLVGRHKYNVVFGIGNKRFKTDVQQDPTGNPIWTEESTMYVRIVYI